MQSLALRGHREEAVAPDNCICRKRVPVERLTLLSCDKDDRWKEPAPSQARREVRRDIAFGYLGVRA